MFSKKSDGSANYYWAYGSNLSIAQMRVRCPQAIKVGRLFGRCVRLAFRGAADVDIMVGKPDMICPGGLWKITADCEARLDRWEGVTRGTYSKWYFEAEIEKGKKEYVLFYKKNSNGLLLPKEDYYRTILRGYRDFNLDLKYLKHARERARKYNKKNKGAKKVTKLFVYGTLKRGNGNSSRLHGATYLGHAVSQDCYDMASVGFPMIWDNPDEGRPVRGEIYEINDAILKSCDILEGHPRFYERYLREFVSDDGQRHEAWIYVTKSRGHYATANDTPPNDRGELEWFPQPWE